MWPSSVTELWMAASTIVLTWLAQVEGHGRLWEPPSRGSMWRLGYSSPPDYQDMELFCGGFSAQYDRNGGKCGVCGDPWDAAREHEAGGKFAKGITVRKYKVGQVIDVVVELTANHKGYFEFHLCPTDNPFEKVTHECLAKYPLLVETTGRVRCSVPNVDYYTRTVIAIKLRLPAGVKCRACMLQWKYNAGNSWGTDPDGHSCIGCGNQEQFYGCADVAIGYDDVALQKETTPGYLTSLYSKLGTNEQDLYGCTDAATTPGGVVDEGSQADGTTDSDSEWHVGIARYPENDTDGAQGYIFKDSNFIRIVFLHTVNVITVFLIVFLTS